ncbi:LeoA/HP0731 family dynamin-like GTPase [Thermosipho globiformans]|uniref:LeoA/HP0731 family dynamin-like GTPase n=1 Tax=Thermosipho globiformans TaxID=380685 RepID=UPI000F8EBD4E|nr:LeoA/HP0731 family dynamin-like GTPase [Thermosipho globiformans]
MNLNISHEKENIILKLKSLLKKVDVLEAEFFSNEKYKSLKEKIKKAINNIENDKFSIAFFGAFSDGKSTILSVLIDELSIEISPAPTTDRIQTYKYKDYFLIDTPGLFSENLFHDELTKKYISEANVIIYVVDPVNPLKKSHFPTLKWLLSDLNKIDSTIFVINKMDEVADLEDDEDFEKTARIKKEVVSDIVRKITGFEGELKIVCVSADPYGKGLSYWKNNENYKKLSRIENLEFLISDFIEKYKNELIVKAGISVIKDSYNQIISDLNKLKDNLKRSVDEIDNQIKEQESYIQNLEDEINKSYINIKNEIHELREEILLGISAAKSKEEINNFIQSKFGKDGKILEDRINLIIEKHTSNLISDVKKIIDLSEKSINSFPELKLVNSIPKEYLPIVLSIINTSNRNLGNIILKIRNFLKIPFKFKPWGAIKLAKFMKGSIFLLGFVADAVEYFNLKKLESYKEEIKDEIEKIFENLMKELTRENYIKNYFPIVNDIRNMIILLEDKRNIIVKKINKIVEISSDLIIFQ